MTVGKHKHPREPEPEKTESQTPGAEGEIDIERLAEDLAQLQTEMERVRTDAEESRDRYLRTLADFDNYRKRQRDDTCRQINLAREELILSILPIMDNLQRTLESAEAGHSYDLLVEGVSLTLRQMTEAMQKVGVQPIDAVGQEFNPELHEAMMRVETDEYPENTIVEEFERGYTIDGKVIRPSRVRVASSTVQHG